MVDAYERKAHKVLELVNNWRMGSQPMERERFLATVRYALELLEEVAEEEDGFEWPD